MSKNPRIQPQIKKTSRPSIDIKSLHQKTITASADDSSIVETIVKNANDPDSNNFEYILQTRVKKPFVEEFIRDTFYLENNIFATLHNLIDNYKKEGKSIPRGLKSIIANEAFKLYFAKNGIDIVDCETASNMTSKYKRQ